MFFRSRLAYTLLTAYILTFYSEWMFWAGRPPSATFFLEALPTWLLYAFITFLFLTAVTYFRINSLWAIILAGVLYGWLLEGIIVQTMYDSFPLNISWTGLAWHALISVTFGWWWLPRRLRQGKGFIPCLLFGLALGLWSTGWWTEPDVPIAAPEVVLIYDLLFGLLLLPAYILWSRFDLATFRPSRLEVIIAIVLLILYFIFITVPAQPLALVVLPPMLALTIWALRRNRAHSPEVPSRVKKISLRHALPLLLIPVVASAVYTLARLLGLTLPTLQILYIMAMPLGFIAFGVSIYKIVFRALRHDST